MAEHHSDNHTHHPLRWTRRELLALLLALRASTLIALATVVFGWAGPIASGLVLTLAAFVPLTWITLG